MAAACSTVVPGSTSTRLSSIHSSTRLSATAGAVAWRRMAVRRVAPRFPMGSPREWATTWPRKRSTNTGERRRNILLALVRKGKARFVLYFNRIIQAIILTWFLPKETFSSARINGILGIFFVQLLVKNHNNSVLHHPAHHQAQWKTSRLRHKANFALPNFLYFCGSFC